jgi:predicted AAA+ superfamily ATPase
MQRYIPRQILPRLAASVRSMPVTAILGPRQCGKSTLARAFLRGIRRSLCLDLEKPSDLARLRDPEVFFSSNSEALICLDEIQRAPELFPVMRSSIDEMGRNGRFLILGSASPELLRQGSESLAGRIRWLELTPFLLQEVAPDPDRTRTQSLWLRGGFPRSWLASTNRESNEWRQDFIRAFLERDIPQLGVRIPAKTLERFWQMCAHVHGQLFNSSLLGQSLGVSHHTIRSYLDLLQQTWMLRVLLPFSANMKKRLIKSPKIFIRDSGILHTLHGLQTFNDLLGHPVYGASWEGFVVENILALATDWRASYYRTSSGNEVDLLLEKGKHRIAVECKASSAPESTRGFPQALQDLDVQEAWIIAPVREAYPVSKNVTVAPLEHFLARIRGRVQRRTLRS